MKEGLPKGGKTCRMQSKLVVWLESPGNKFTETRQASSIHTAMLVMHDGSHDGYDGRHVIPDVRPYTSTEKHP